MEEYISREAAKEAAALIAMTSAKREMTCGEVKKIMEDIPPANVVRADGLTPEARDFVRMCPELVNLTVKKLTEAWDKAFIYGTDPPAAQAVPSPMIEAARNGEVYL